MNAIEFVKNYGIDEAIEKVQDCEFLNAEFFNWMGNDVCVSDLKQIVDAWELVDKFGGIDKSKRILKKAYDLCSQIILDSRKNIETTWNDLNDAINLVEQCNA